MQESNKNVTSNIIFNLAQMGISVRDSELFDIQTYIELVEIQASIYSKNPNTNRKATQKDIDLFLL